MSVSRSSFDTFDPLNGVTASDTEDGNVTSSLAVEIHIDGTKVNEVPSEYIGDVVFKVSVKDSINQEVSLFMKVTIYDDYVDLVPVIYGVVDQTIYTSDLDTFDVLMSITASDTEDGDITSNISVVMTIDGQVVTEIPTDFTGTINLVYSVTDTYNHTVTETCVITVLADMIEIPSEISEQFEYAVYSADFLYYIISGQTPTEVCDYINMFFETEITTDECMSMLNGYLALGYTDVLFGDYTFVGMDGSKYVLDTEVFLLNDEGYPTLLTVRVAGELDENDYIIWGVRDIPMLESLNTRQVPVSPLEAEMYILEFYDNLFHEASVTAQSFCTMYENLGSDYLPLSTSACEALFNNAHIKGVTVVVNEIDFVFATDELEEHFLVYLQYVDDMDNYLVAVEFFFKEDEQGNVTLGSILPFSSFEQVDPNNLTTPLVLDEDYMYVLLSQFYRDFMNLDIPIDEFCDMYITDQFTHDCDDLAFYRNMLEFNDLYISYPMASPTDPSLFNFTIYYEGSFDYASMDVAFTQKENGLYTIYIYGNILGSENGVNMFTVPLLPRVWNNDTQKYNTDEIMIEYLTDFFDDTMSNSAFHTKWDNEYSIFTQSEISNLRDQYSNYEFYDVTFQPTFGTDFDTGKVFQVYDGSSYHYYQAYYTLLEVEGETYLVLRSLEFEESSIN